MANGSWNWYGSTVQHWRCRINVTRTESATTATVTVKCYWESIDWGYQVYGQSGSATCDSTTVNGSFNAVSATGASASVLVATASKSFTRRATAYNINTRGVVTLNGGYHNGTSDTQNHAVTITALDVTEPGAPTNVTAKRNEDSDIDITYLLN